MGVGVRAHETRSCRDELPSTIKELISAALLIVSLGRSSCDVTGLPVGLGQCW
jgi:hypothetical protein